MTAPRPILRGVGCCALLAVVMACPGNGWAATEKVLYSFQGGTDGASPNGPLLADAAGNLYGTTVEGGSAACSAGCGTVFKLSPPAQNAGVWTEEVLYRFQGGSDGAAPASGLIADSAGNLFGTTLGGGSKGSDGIVFELSPPVSPGGRWTESVLYRFQGGDDGKYPMGRLIFDAAGNIYGTTIFGGGRENGGIAFQLSPPARTGVAWSETVLHRFRVEDGLDPMSGVILGPHGTLYGTTRSNTVFKLAPPPPGASKWTFQLIHLFSGSHDPSQLCAVIRKGGVLYGSSLLGGGTNAGTVFQLERQGGVWSATTLHSFIAASDGEEPCAILISDSAGALYGTSVGNDADSFGSVYRLTPPFDPAGQWSFTVLYLFSGGNDGSAPNDGVIFARGHALYGVTQAGGAAKQGTIFKIVP